MAGDWIKVESSTPDKPEVVQMAQQLEMDQDAVFGKLMRLWIWADQQTLTGNARGVTKTWIDRYTYCAGFADAMQSAGWLIEENGEIAFPNFERHNGQTAKSRALTAKRVQKLRNAPSVTSALPEKRREEKRRSNTKKNKAPAVPVIFPATLDTDECRQAWDRWLEHKRLKGSPYKGSDGQNTRLRQLAELGPERFCAAIDYSIGQNWSGIFEQQQQPQRQQQPSRAEQRQAEMLEQERRMLRR